MKVEYTILYKLYIETDFVPIVPVNVYNKYTKYLLLMRHVAPSTNQYASHQIFKLKVQNNKNGCKNLTQYTKACLCVCVCVCV